MTKVPNYKFKCPYCGHDRVKRVIQNCTVEQYIDIIDEDGITYSAEGHEYIETDTSDEHIQCNRCGKTKADWYSIEAMVKKGIIEIYPATYDSLLCIHEGMCSRRYGLKLNYKVLGKEDGLMRIAVNIPDGNTFTRYGTDPADNDKLVFVDPHGGPMMAVGGNLPMLLGYDTGDDEYIIESISVDDARDYFIFICTKRCSNI